MRCRTAVFAMLLACGSPGVLAGSNPALKSSAATVHLSATVDERLSVVSATPSVHFLLAPQTIAHADRPLAITTSWNLDPNRSEVVVRAFFSDPASALATQESAAAVDRISGSEVFARAATGTPRAFTSFATTGSSAGPTGGLEIFRQPLHPGVNDQDSRTDVVELQLDLRSRARLSAGHYDGVLTLVAQAY